MTHYRIEFEAERPSNWTPDEDAKRWVSKLLCPDEEATVRVVWLLTTGAEVRELLTPSFDRPIQPL